MGEQASEQVQHPQDTFSYSGHLWEVNGVGAQDKRKQSQSEVGLGKLWAIWV